MPNLNLMDAGQLPVPRNAVASDPASLAERRARTLAPTIFCPASNVEQCIRQAAQSRTSP